MSAHEFSDYVTGRLEFEEGLFGLQHIVEELNLWAPLSHPHILHLDGVVLDSQLLFPKGSVSALAQCDLASFAKSRMGALNFVAVADISIQVFTALAYLHEQRPPIVHGDVKLANMLLFPEGDRLCVKLGDFGQSRRVIEGRFPNIPFQGFLQPPELLATDAWIRPYSFSCDVYCAAASISQLVAALFLHKTWPLGRSARLTAVERYLSLIAEKPERAGLGRVLLACLSADPDARPSAQTAADMLKDSMTAFSSSPSVSSMPSTPHRLPQSVRVFRESSVLITDVVLGCGATYRVFLAQLLENDVVRPLAARVRRVSRFFYPCVLAW